MIDTEATNGPGGDGQADGALSGRAGWFVVGILVLAGVVAPLLLYAAGQSGGLQALGLGFRDTYLAIPMVPAILLGGVGVWSALKGR